MNTILKILRIIRSPIMRWLKPAKFISGRSLTPLSDKYGYDRGKPIDRYYIEKFLGDNKGLIRGRCLEIHDSAYTISFGGDRVEVSDVLDIHTSNNKATIYGDIQNLPQVQDDTYDTVILTQTLGMVADCDAAIRECYRVLKPGGIILFTSKAMGPVFDSEGSYWKFTRGGIKYIFAKYFSSDNLRISSYGNVLVGQAFWVGMAAEELTQKELDYNDQRYEILITAVAKK